MKKLDAYLVLAKKRVGWGDIRVVRVSRYKPTLSGGECAVRIKMSIPDEAFEPFFAAPEQTIEIGEVLRHTTLEVVKP